MFTKYKDVQETTTYGRIGIGSGSATRAIPSSTTTTRAVGGGGGGSELPAAGLSTTRSSQRYVSSVDTANIIAGNVAQRRSERGGGGSRIVASSSPPKRALADVALGHSRHSGSNLARTSYSTNKSPKYALSSSPSSSSLLLRRNSLLLNDDDDDDDDEEEEEEEEEEEGVTRLEGEDEDEELHLDEDEDTNPSLSKSVDRCVSERLHSLRITRSSSRSFSNSGTYATTPDSSETTTPTDMPASLTRTSGRTASSSTPFSPSRQRMTAATRRAKTTTANAARRGGLTGLRNLGNTCFMNSCLQCLAHTPIFSSDFLDIEPRQRSGDTADAFADVMENLRGNDGAFSPALFKSTMSRVAPYFRGRGQHDAHEFLRVLLDALHEDTNRVKIKPEYKEEKDIKGEPEDFKSDRLWRSYTSRADSVVTDTFAGQLQSTVRCCRCRTLFTTYDAIWDLSLQLPVYDGKGDKQGGRGGGKKGLRSRSVLSPTASTATITLDECLESFTREESLDGNEAYYCSSCKKHCGASKTLRLSRFPKVLVVHLKRFSSGTFRREKLNSRVDFPLRDLDLSEFVAEDMDVDVPMYDLICVSNHIGGMHGGHYTAYCKSAADEWYCFDDSSVRKMSEDDIVSSSAYFLVYESRS